MIQSHFNGKRSKRKKERALKKSLSAMERSLARIGAAMTVMTEALNTSALAIAAAYKPLIAADPRNWRHKKKLLNRKELTR